jgi:hypothetical protein
MRSRFRDYEHVVRVLVLFLAGVGAFLAVRSWLVPHDFGVYGHYRGGALEENRTRPISFAGRGACAECHDDVVASRKGSRHERIACEACHGALASHASGDDAAKPSRPDPRISCIRCHDARAGKPAAFPQVDVKDHAPEGPCTECHQPHHPAVS